MSKNNIYIITIHELETNNTKILSIFQNNLKAIEFFQKQIEKNSKKGYQLVFTNEKKIQVYERLVGWVTTSKNLKYIYQIHEHNKYPDDYNGIDTIEEHNSE